MTPFTPAEERVALEIAQAGADGILEWMRTEGLLSEATTALVVGFDHRDGRLVVAIKWVQAGLTSPTGHA